MAKFSPQSRRDLTAAVRRYNSMRTRFIRTNHPTYEIPKADIKTILDSATNTQDLRESIKQLNDLKRLTDFNLSQETELPITVAEMRTFKRLDKAMRQQYKKELAKLQQKQLEAVQAGNMAAVMAQTHDIQELQKKPADLKRIRTVKGFRGAIARYQRERITAKKFGTIKVPEAETVSLDHFIAAMGKMGLFLTTQGQTIYEKIKGMNAKEWAKLVSEHPNVFTLDNIYNISKDAYAKMNEISAALNMSIASEDLNSEADYADED